MQIHDRAWPHRFGERRVVRRPWVEKLWASPLAIGTLDEVFVQG